MSWRENRLTNGTDDIIGVFTHGERVDKRGVDLRWEYEQGADHLLFHPLKMRTQHFLIREAFNELENFFRHRKIS